MIIFYGRAKVGTAFQELCTYLGKECYILDDKDENIDESLLERAEIIVPTPGLPQTHRIYQTYAQKIVSELDMCQRIMQEKGLIPHSIGITGTDGKSTVTWIVAEVLRQVLPAYTTHITGNFDDAMSKTIYNILTTDHVGSDTRDKHIFVVECSSFMLYPTKEYSFDIGLWTNFAPDHLNRHPSMAEYFAAKQQLIIRSTCAFVNEAIMEKLSTPLREKSTVYPTTYDLSDTNFIGSHNARNCALAEIAVHTFCEMHHLIVLPETIHQAISTVLPLKHRMQPCKTLQGITRYDDGKSTSAQSLGAALEGFTEKVIVMVGGSDKGDDFGVLTHIFQTRVAHAICMGQTAEKFATVCQSAGVDYTIVASMAENVKTAWGKAQEHHVSSIVFSPGCASFDMFRNYEDRAEQFLDEVQKIV